jgi:hypothetical protein
MKIRPYTRLIFKINRGPAGFGGRFNAWKFFFLPSLYRFSVLLVCAIKRPLAAKAQLPSIGIGGRFGSEYAEM